MDQLGQFVLGFLNGDGVHEALSQRQGLGFSSPDSIVPALVVSGHSKQLDLTYNRSKCLPSASGRVCEFCINPPAGVSGEHVLPPAFVYRRLLGAQFDELPGHSGDFMTRPAAVGREVSFRSNAGEDGCGTQSPLCSVFPEQV